ncbi:retrovirus-related pol polyprotein from transposon TNT 1-94 [Tanacetum coccineum]
MVPRTVLTRRPFNKITAANNSNFTKKVNIVKGTKVNTARPKAVLSVVKENKGNVVKASACWVWRPKHKVLDHGNPQQDLKDKGVIDTGCSRHMTGNISYLTDYEEIDGGIIAFGGNSKGGKITGKVPRKDNMYSVELIMCSLGGLMFSFAKATPDESNLWHKRLGHGHEFKNRVMNQFCEMKGIKREFSVSKTLQQNGVAEWKNRTLIEAARTMLVDLKLPTTFWAEAVNTACYVKNRVLVIKPHNKTPYELFLGHILWQDYILLPLWTQDLPFSSSSKDSPNVGFKPSGEEEKKDAKDPGNESGNPTKGKDSEMMMKMLGMSDDMNNLDAFMPVSPIPTIRIHKDHPVEQIIGYLNSAPQTRRMTKNLKEHEEPKKVIQALKDQSWIEAMQDELLQFNFQKVWTLVDLLNGKRAIGTKWVYKNKKDERGIMIKNKARLVAQGYTQEKGIDYEEIEEAVYVWQRQDLKIPGFPDEYTIVKKASYVSIKLLELMISFLGLQRRSYSHSLKDDDKKFLDETSLCLTSAFLKKFGFSNVKTANTPMETYKPLLKDADGEDVDEHMYRSMIGSLVYLTSLRPDIMISPFDLVAYTDSDYAGASLNRKFTTGEHNMHSEEPCFHSKTKHIEIRHHFIRDSNEKKLIPMIKIHTDKNVADLLQLAFERKQSRRKQRKDTEIPQSSGPTEPIADEVANEENVPTQSNDPPLSRVNTLRSGEDKLNLRN